MSLRIAFDLDGVLADMDTELRRRAEALFGQAMTHRLQERRESGPPGDASGPPQMPGSDLEGQAVAESVPDNLPRALKLSLTSSQQRELWLHVAATENFWEGLKEIEPGAVARLGRIAAERRWEIIFLTTRPETAGRTSQVQSQRWLESMGFTLPSVYVVRGSRGGVAAALGLAIVVDDRPENCVDVVADSKARAILMWRKQAEQRPEAARRLGIGVVRSVAECLDILTSVDTASPEPVGMMERVRRLLGLKEPAITSET